VGKPEPSGDHPWTRRIPKHPKRTNSPEYVRSRKKMNELARTIDGFFYGDEPYEDHHGGGLWLKDGDGWFIVRNLAGMEWSSQFCADPAKVDLLRKNAKRLYDRFPDAVDELEIRELLDTPIKTSEDVARWTDSICNASMPLDEEDHRGTLPGIAGIHHYPGPVAEIQFFKYKDFELWVENKETEEVLAVAPVGTRDSGEGSVRLLFAAPVIKPIPPPALDAEDEGVGPRGVDALRPQGFEDIEIEIDDEGGIDDVIIPASSPIAQAAFRNQR
jgi:hypothetical protein